MKLFEFKILNEIIVFASDIDEATENALFYLKEEMENLQITEDVMREKLKDSFTIISSISPKFIKGKIQKIDYTINESDEL